MGLAYSRTYTPFQAVVNNICLTQTPLAAGPLTLNGSTVVNGVAVLSSTPPLQQGVITITPAANETGHNFTVTGTNSDGVTQSEVMAGTNAVAFNSQLSYTTITSIVISAAATGAIQVGTSNTGATPWLAIDTMRQPINVGIECIVTGTINYTLQYTTENFWTPPVVINNAFNHATLANVTTNQYGSITTPVTGIRVFVNSNTSGTVTINYTQAGP